VKTKWREQERARLLRKRGKTLNEIVRHLGVSKGSVSIWVRGIKLTPAQQQRIEKRRSLGAARGRQMALLRWRNYRKINLKPEQDSALKRNLERIKNFFSKWSDDMAYVLGFFAADGCMYHSVNGGHSTGGYYIVFNSTDFQLLETVKRVMQIRNKIEAEDRTKQNSNWKIKYFIRLVNRDLYQTFLGFGMTPAKSLTLQFPQMPREYLASFVRGYFDGDGCVYCYKSKLGRKGLLTSFTSGSKSFLEVLREKLGKIDGISGGSLITRSSRHFVLQYSTNDSRQLHNFMYPTTTVPCLKRKRAIFDKAFQ
jgi:hypothetical protein